MSRSTVKYNNILVARHSPLNKCFAKDGAILFLKPKKITAKKGHSSHYFVSCSDAKTKSKYGWVRRTEPITLVEFVEKYLPKTAARGVMEDTKVMLESIQKLNEDTPVAATYSEHGFEQKEMILTVHRVFFYQ
ncbi:MAG: hypothetical protein ACKO96_20710 [Flammeovirgaceae bacterium]